MEDTTPTISSVNASDELPKPVSDYLFDESNVDLNERIFDDNGVRPADEPKILGIIRKAITKEIPLEGLSGALAEALNKEQDALKKLVSDIAGFRLLPLNGYLGDVDGFIRSLGGDPSSYPETRIKIQEMTTDSAVKDVERIVGTTDLPHRLKSRFEDALRSFFKGVRTESQLIDLLTRPEKIGGVGLEMDVAKEVVMKADEERRSVVIEDEPVGGAVPPKPVVPAPSSAPTDEVSGEQRGATASRPTPPEKPKSDFTTIHPEDEEEIEMMRKRIPEDAEQKSAETDAKIKASVEELFKAAGVGAGSSETLQARFKKIIENRLRDIRDQLETLEILVQPKELGGMSLSQDDARRIVALIEAKLKSVHEMHQEQVKEKKSQWVSEKAHEAVERDERQKAEAQVAREEAFKHATERTKKPVSTSGSKPVPPGNLPVPAGNAAAPVPPTLPKPTSRPPMTAAPKPTGQGSVIATPPNQVPKTPVRTSVPQAMPAPTPVKPPAKPVMSDVKGPRPAATGPVEELRTTTIEDFRRLSKDPSAAAGKIKDKVDLLAEDSYAKKMQGIAAWNESGVYRLYMEMMGEALEGKPMDEVISSRQAEKKPVLSKEEMNAIVQLGISLRA